MFLLVMVAIVFAMIGGISLMQNKYQYYLRLQYAVLQWDYLKTEIAYIDYNYGGVGNWFTQHKKSDPVPLDGKDAKLIPVLVYHGIITDPNWKPDGTNISLQDFQNQMFALKAAGWQTISMEDYLAFIQNKKQLPEKSFLLTFDDGRKDSFYNGDPVLRAVGYEATMFVITGASMDDGPSPFHLSREELQQMIKTGRWEMGSHTQNGHGSVPVNSAGKWNHFLTNEMWLAGKNKLETEPEYLKRITTDLEGAKLDLENKLGVKPVLAFAYPYGDYGQDPSNFPQDQSILDNIVSSIYPISFIQASNNDYVANPADGSAISKRIEVDSSIDSAHLVSMLDNSRYKNLDYTDDFSKDNGWLEGWGSRRIDNNEMLVGATASDDSASTFLSGSSLWKNYLMSVKAEILSSDSFSLVARYIGEDDYATCDFSGDAVELSQKVHGQDRPTIEARLWNEITPGVAVSAAIEVNGNTATCYLNGTQVLTGTIDPALDRGGIGFKMWDPAHKGTLVVRNLKVVGMPSAFPVK